MKKYKLKKDFLYLPAGTVVDIFTKEIEWTITVKKYVISIKDHLIAEIAESTKFSFEDYFEEIKEEGKSIFNLKGWDKYYYLFSDWDIGLRHYYWPEIYKDLIENGNAFLTKEEAEKEVKRRQSIFNIKKYCWENNIKYKENVSDNGIDTYIIYNRKIKEFQIEFNQLADYCQINSFIFLSIENGFDKIDKFLEDCESDLKTIFEVE